mgnify:CR=1 FL=1
MSETSNEETIVIRIPGAVRECLEEKAELRGLDVEEAARQALRSGLFVPPPALGRWEARWNN